MKLAHLFFNVNMSNGHLGLSEILFKERKIRDALVDECAIFINKKFTALKMLTENNVILHLKRPANEPINPDTIKYLPYCVHGEELNYSKALETAIRQKFGKYETKAGGR